MFITKMSLPRRTFLRGVGATVALPLLEAMVPAFTALAKTAANPCADSRASMSRTDASWIASPRSRAVPASSSRRS